jgi:hypothetical protein
MSQGKETIAHKNSTVSSLAVYRVRSSIGVSSYELEVMSLLLVLSKPIRRE